MARAHKDDELPSAADDERFTRLFNAHLAQASTSIAADQQQPYRDNDDNDIHDNILDPTAQLDAFRAALSSSPQRRQHYDILAEHLRRAFHASHEQRRRAQLHSLLVQLPPFSRAPLDDDARLCTPVARTRRRRHLAGFAARFARNVGVRPFFAALRRLLDAQAHDRAGRPLQWLLDDAVLMEAGGDDFMRAAVYTLKAILLFDEQSVADANPFADPGAATTSNKAQQGDEHTQATDAGVIVMRTWTVSPLLSNRECASLARAIPSHVLPRRGRGSAPAYADDALLRLAREDNDEERRPVVPAPIELPTGALRYAPLPARRRADFRGNWLEWLLDCVLSVVRIPGL